MCPVGTRTSARRTFVRVHMQTSSTTLVYVQVRYAGRQPPERMGQWTRLDAHTWRVLVPRAQLDDLAQHPSVLSCCSMNQ